MLKSLWMFEKIIVSLVQSITGITAPPIIHLDANQLLEPSRVRSASTATVRCRSKLATESSLKVLRLIAYNSTSKLSSDNKVHIVTNKTLKAANLMHEPARLRQSSARVCKTIVAVSTAITNKRATNPQFYIGTINSIESGEI